MIEGDTGHNIVQSGNDAEPEEQSPFYINFGGGTAMLDIGGLQRTLGRPLNDDENMAIGIKMQADIFGRSIAEEIQRCVDAGIIISDAAKTILDSFSTERNQ